MSSIALQYICSGCRRPQQQTARHSDPHVLLSLAPTSWNRILTFQQSAYLHTSFTGLNVNIFSSQTRAQFFYRVLSRLIKNDIRTIDNLYFKSARAFEAGTEIFVNIYIHI
jgi:hypothetical protein